MKKIIKVFLVVVIMFALAAGGVAFYMTRGLEAGEALALDGISAPKLEDGAYTGKYDGGRWSNEVMIKIKDERITGIFVIKAVLFERPEITQQLFDRVLMNNVTVPLLLGGGYRSKKLSVEGYNPPLMLFKRHV